MCMVTGITYIVGNPRKIGVSNHSSSLTGQFEFCWSSVVVGVQLLFDGMNGDTELQF